MEHMGFLSILPPLIAVVLAMRTKNVLLSLFAGAFVGVVILCGWNPATALPTMIKDFIFKQAASSYNSSIMVLMTFVGGMVALLTNSGGAAAFAMKATKFINTKAKAIIATWLGGLFIWFSDSANALLLGPLFQPITDKLRISREKLAWIVDSTSSPICVLIPIIGWGIYIMGTIEKEFAALNLDLSEWTTFIQAIPYQFYAWGALLLIPLMAYTGIDFGPMSKAEERAMKKGQLVAPGAKPLRPAASIELPEGVTPRISVILWPLAVVFVVFFAMLFAHGFPYKKIPGPVLRTGLTSGYFLGAMVCMALMVKNKIKSSKECFDIYINGMQSMLFILMVLVLAWSLSSVCKHMGTANYIIQLTKGNIPVWTIAPLIFLTGAFISFATGTSYGTFAILMPIAIPMSVSLGAPMLPCIAAVLSGGLFGDHCSPISDTTIMSSMGAACDHIDHVKTQLPYAITVAVASFITYTAAFWIHSGFVLLAFSLLLMALLTIIQGKIWGNKTPNYTIEEIEQVVPVTTGD